MIAVKLRPTTASLAVFFTVTMKPCPVSIPRGLFDRHR